MNFSQKEMLRRELLKNIDYSERYQNTSIINDEFKRKFMLLIEKCILELMEKEDSFFGLFMVKVKREIDIYIASPVATEPSYTGFIMYFNPLYFLRCTPEEMKALIKHEIYHIMFGHLYRVKDLYNRYSKLAVNLAMDISVNQFVKDLPTWSAKLDTVTLTYSVDLKEEGTLEQYAKEIQKALDKLQQYSVKNSSNNKDNLEKLFDIEKTHDKWLNSESVDKDAIKELTKKTALASYKSELPKGLEEIVKGYMVKPELSWQDYIKRLLKTMPEGNKKTITRKNRRQPERLDLKGQLKDRIAQIIVAIDISGSITDGEIEQIIIEIFGILKNQAAQVTIIECDNKIRKVYKIKSRRDIQKRSDNRGGTAFNPVFQYIKEKRLKDAILIYFTDGLGESELKVKPYNYKTLWVLTGKGEKISLKDTYGEVKRLKKVTTSSVDGTYGVQIMREMLQEWAR